MILHREKPLKPNVIPSYFHHFLNVQESPLSAKPQPMVPRITGPKGPFLEVFRILSEKWHSGSIEIRILDNSQPRIAIFKALRPHYAITTTFSLLLRMLLSFDNFRKQRLTGI